MANAGWLSALYGCARIFPAIRDCLGPLFDDLLRRTTLGFKILLVPNQRPKGENSVGKHFSDAVFQTCVADRWLAAFLSVSQTLGALEQFSADNLFATLFEHLVD